MDGRGRGEGRFGQDQFQNQYQNQHQHQYQHQHQHQYQHHNNLSHHPNHQMPGPRETWREPARDARPPPPPPPPPRHRRPRSRSPQRWDARTFPRAASPPRDGFGTRGPLPMQRSHMPQHGDSRHGGHAPPQYGSAYTPPQVAQHGHAYQSPHRQRGKSVREGGFEGRGPTQRGRTPQHDDSRQGAHAPPQYGSAQPPPHGLAQHGHAYQSPPRAHGNSFTPHVGHSPPRHDGHLPLPPPPPPRRHSLERMPLAPSPRQWQQHSPPLQRRRPLSPSWHDRAPRGASPKRPRYVGRDEGNDGVVDDRGAGIERFERHQESGAEDRFAQSPVYVAPSTPVRDSPGALVLDAPATPLIIIDSPAENVRTPSMDAPRTPLSASEAPASPQYDAPPSPFRLRDIPALASPCLGSRSPITDRASPACTPVAALTPESPVYILHAAEAHPSPGLGSRAPVSDAPSSSASPAGTPVTAPAPQSPVYIPQAVDARPSPVLDPRSPVLDAPWPLASPAGTPVTAPTPESPVYILPAVDASPGSPYYALPPVSLALAPTPASARSGSHEWDGGGRRDDSRHGGSSGGERFGQGAQSPAVVGFGEGELTGFERAGRSDVGGGDARVREGGRRYDDLRQGGGGRDDYQRDVGRGAGGSGQAYGARHGSGVNGDPRRDDRLAQPYGRGEPYGRGQDRSQERSQDRNWDHRNVRNARSNFPDSRHGGYGREAHPRNHDEGREPPALDEESAALRQRELFGGSVRDSGYHYAWTSATTSRLHRIDVERSGNLFYVDPSRPTRPLPSRKRGANAVPSPPAGPDRPPPVQNDEGVLPAVPSSEDDSDNEVAIVLNDGEGGDGTGYMPKNTYGEAELTGEAASKFPPHLATSAARIELIRLQVRNNADGEELRTDLMHPASSAFINGTFEIGYIRQLQRAVKHEVANAKKRKGGRRRRAAKAARNQEALR